MNNLALKLRTAREGLGLSQAELAQAVGVTQGAITHIEVGRKRPSVDLLVRLGAALSIPADELVGDLLAGVAGEANHAAQ